MKPFRSTPVEVSEVYRETLARRRRRLMARPAFAFGMMGTN
jgi:hypothetical protein